MFKKFKSGVLIIVLIVLLVVYLFVRYAGSNDRTFKDKILEIDTSSLTGILVTDPKSGQEPVDLRYTGDKWMVRINGVEYPADTNTVKGVLNQLGNLATKRFAGKGNDAWVKYELTDSTAQKITIKAGSKVLADLLVGKFAYSMPQGQSPQMQGRQKGDMTTYVRLADEKEVYAVDGYLKMSISSNPDSYRVRSLVNVNPADITRISVNSQGTNTILENINGKWQMNGNQADSATMAKYRNSLSRLTGSKFTDQPAIQTFPSHTLRIEGNNFSPVDLQAFPVADTNIKYLITSSANPGANFSGKDGGLFKRIWEQFEF